MRTALLGTGVLGTGMAHALARAGHDVVVWNRTRSRAEAVGLPVADSVTEAVTGADAVLTVLFDTDAVLSVTDEVVAALGPDAVWLQASTVGPDGIRAVAAAAGDGADRLLDAPVLGTRKPAEDGTLVVLVSGSRALRERAGAVTDAIGSRVLVAGDDLGAASALKLACNSWVGLLTAGTAQAIGLAAAQGVAPALFLQAITGGAVDAPYAHIKGAAMLDGDYDEVSFAVDGVRKDTALMVEAAHAAGLRTDLLQAVLTLFDDASARGFGDADMAAVHAAFEVGEG